MTKPPALTPAARAERAKRAIAEAVSDLITATLEQGASQVEWVNQKSSPLGRRKHCELVRKGKLPGYRHGRDVLVRRADMNAYLEREGVRPVTAANDDEAVVDIVEELLAPEPRASGSDR